MAATVDCCDHRSRTPHCCIHAGFQALQQTSPGLPMLSDHLVATACATLPKSCLDFGTKQADMTSLSLCLHTHHTIVNAGVQRVKWSLTKVGDLLPTPASVFPPSWEDLLCVCVCVCVLCCLLCGQTSMHIHLPSMTKQPISHITIANSYFCLGCLWQQQQQRRICLSKRSKTAMVIMTVSFPL